MGAVLTFEIYDGLIIGAFCPIEYCKTEYIEFRMNTLSLDRQCALNRTGLLCGACVPNYSLMLGGSNCQICSYSHLTLIIPFAVMGASLVAFLIFFKLTVASGVLNSVILYANVLQTNRHFFFSSNARNVLTVFIAWLNLDFGFKTCFYNGLDLVHYKIEI